MSGVSDILDKMTVEAFIPARYASTRLHGKPLADIGGKPMIEWVCERATNASLVEAVTVATDDERIFKVVTAFGGRAVMTSDRHRSGTDRIAEAAAKSAADIIVNVQGDEPLIEPDMIDAAIRPMLEDPDLLMCTLKTPIEVEEEYLSPHSVKVVTDSSGYALYFSRSPIPNHKAFGDAYATVEPFKHIGLYVYRRDFLLKLASLSQTPLERIEKLEQLRALENGYRIRVVETPFSPISVDTEEDLLKVRHLVEMI